LKKYPCTLKEFLLLGQLGFLEIGMPRKNIIEHIGLPANFDKYQELESQKVWSYNSLSLGWDVEAKALSTIAIHIDRAIRLPESLYLLDYAPTMDTSLEEFKYFLNSEKIDYMQNRHPQVKSITILGIHPNIQILFDQDGEHPQLIGKILCNYNIDTAPK